MDARTSAPLCILFDNGSLRPEATLNLRVIALWLQAVLGVDVRPVSLLHASAIAPGELGGISAQIPEPALRALLKAGVNDLLLLPLFFGPSAALTEYVPQRLEHLHREFSAMRVWLGRWLADPGNRSDTRLAAILAVNVCAVIRDRRLSRPNVVLVDRGSPQRVVVAVRDCPGRADRPAAGEGDRPDGDGVHGAPQQTGVRLLRTPPGRRTAQRRVFPWTRGGGAAVHLAGPTCRPRGDIADICAAAERAQPGLKTHLTDLMGGDQRLLDLLADRDQEARASAPV